MSTESQPGKGSQPLLFLNEIFMPVGVNTSPKLVLIQSVATHRVPATDWKPQIQPLLPAPSPTLSHIPPLNRSTPTTVNSTPKLAPDLPPLRCHRNPANALLSVCPSLTGVPSHLSASGHGRNCPGSLLPPTTLLCHPQVSLFPGSENPQSLVAEALY